MYDLSNVQDSRVGNAGATASRVFGYFGCCMSLLHLFFHNRAARPRGNGWGRGAAGEREGGGRESSNERPGDAPLDEHQGDSASRFGPACAPPAAMPPPDPTLATETRTEIAVSLPLPRAHAGLGAARIRAMAAFTTSFAGGRCRGLGRARRGPQGSEER